VHENSNEEALDDFFQFDGAAAPSSADDVTLPGDEGRRPVPPRLGLLANLGVAEFDQVARAAKLAFVPAETVVFRQGDNADRFFILVDGGVEIVRDDEQIATLGPGSFFGESALLVQGQRSATVQTVVDSSLWSVSYDAFTNAVSRHLLADDDAAAEAHRRIAETPEGGFGTSPTPLP
jgi:CRP-like cAMP-binding protein